MFCNCFAKMKSKIFRNGTATVRLIVCWSAMLCAAAAAGGGAGGARPAGPSGPSERPEAYFNRSSYIRLSKPISLKQIVGLSFRTCVGGELFSQRYEGYSLHVTALFEHVVVSWTWPGLPAGGSTRLERATLDNRWHWVALRRRLVPPGLLLEVDRDTQLVANATFNAELVNGGPLESASATLLVGNLFSGCIHEGPQLEFHATATSQEKNVVFGNCPLTTDECKDRQDVLRMPPKDFCFNEPCLRHGTCISRHDRYECHCAARYTGNNCQVDKGNPCLPEPCEHGGRCVEDARGDYTCFCPPQYHGVHCEFEVSLDPLCVAGPCRNNGSCSVPAGADTYICECPPGYTGRNCETDVDECAGADAACLNGGRCLDAVNNYTCDCSETGYKGARCEINVNECEEERTLCGHGICYDTYGGYVCACLPGYVGDHCQKLSACASSPCGVGGTCFDEGVSFRCSCARGWSGPLCAVPMPSPPALSPSVAPPLSSCVNHVCPEHSHCRDSQTIGMSTASPTMTSLKQAQCYCDPGYFGASGMFPNCSTLELACEVGVCLNGATCSLAADHFNCTCAPGFKGAYCELAAGKALSELKTAERCADAPCMHARSCADLSLGFHCECETGWSGVRCDTAALAPAPAPLSAAVDNCATWPCHNGGTCRLLPDGYSCQCRPGYGGTHCDIGLDCRANGCLPRQACVERGGDAWACELAADSACASSPCHNGTCLALDNGDFDCSCPPGYTGHLCENEIDVCAVMPKICNQGVCIKGVGSFQCYCKPGYTGDRCEQDIDECLSSPCKNGGTCQNLENNYECNCMAGFTGKDCSTNINECESSPCAEGATCVDGIASYSCVCQQGLTGDRCENNIDDCESEPCQHGGRCIDALNGFECRCEGTGYTGADCSLNIDECEPQPCHNGATCVDGLNDYNCRCYDGYTGKNCELDISECESAPCQFGGVCLERSNASLYRTADSGAAPQVGPQPTQLLPAVFYEPFSYENASGFECVCVAGTTGSRCEINIDECASAPCGYGKCIDAVGGYSCDCAPGYEGDHCQLEIDECLRYKPCEHGHCYDRRASYFCECEDGWGGRNCSVVLEGCVNAPCRNNGTCLPWLHRESEHRFNCSCTPGYYGTTCEKITTMSLERNSYAEVNTSREEGYDISFRFKTTLRSGLLAMGRGFTYFVLKLSNGRLNLHSSLLNKWEGVFIGSNLNDSNWQKVFVTINSSHLVLAANEEQTIYPISQNEASNTSQTSFPCTRLGTAGPSFTTLTHEPNFFVGCFQDVVVNGQWVLPEYSNASEAENAVEIQTEDSSGIEENETEMEGGARALLRGVRASCPRKEQCKPNPCHSGGVCEDYWSNYTCTCPRPYLGPTCQYNYTAATFGHETASPQSVVAVTVWEGARRAVRSALDISMFIRTRKPTGTIFYLGSKPRYGITEETLVAASLKNGELLVHLQFNHTPEDYTVGGTRLDNGYLHLIQVVRNSTLVQVKLNGTEYFRKSISAAEQLDAQVLYLGGPPPDPAPPADTTTAIPPGPVAPPAAASAAPALALPPTAAPTLPPRILTDADYFKGIIQDVQISNGVNLTIVEFFPLREPGLTLPPSFGDVSLDPGVLSGERSDDACAIRPCLHNATCTVTWNDYTCECPRGYKGKQCAEVEFCQLQNCPLGSNCRNLDGGYECLSNATFDGVNTTLTYSLRLPTRGVGAGAGAGAGAAPSNEPAYIPPDSLTITYRSKTGGTLLHAELLAGNETLWFSVGVFRDQASVQWRLRTLDLPVLRRVRKPLADLDWSTLRFTLRAATGPPAPAPALPPPRPVASLDFDLIQGAFVDAEGQEEAGFSAPIDAAAWQRLMASGVLRLGGVGPRPDATAPAATLHVDGDRDANAAATVAPTDLTYNEDWSADASLGEHFKGCMGPVHVGGLLLPFFPENELFKGTSADLLRGQSHYALTSGRPWGWETALGCVLCLERECSHGGRCADVRHSYACSCPAGFSGDRCEIDVDECLQNECRNGATCQDELASYTCLCPPGFNGTFCEHDIDECESSPCAHGGTCSDQPGGFECTCAAEWGGPRCERPRRLSCSHRPCSSGHAICKDEIPDPPNGNNYTCVCLEGWEGVHCDEAFCEVRPCAHGRCGTDLKVPACECEPGYSGAYCETERDECEEGGRAACRHGALCIDQLNGFLCNCTGTGWTGAHCELDVDECALHLVSCGPGECRNHDGGYTCQCSPGFCGNECALPDPCYQELATGEDGAGTNTTGPCLHGGVCEQRCSEHVDYICHCVNGWGGTNCSYQVVIDKMDGGGPDSSTVLIAVGAALLGVAALGGALAVLAARARRNRATRGTYSPSGQEYCNPRAEMMHNTLKPPPEERLI